MVSYDERVNATVRYPARTHGSIVAANLTPMCRCRYADTQATHVEAPIFALCPRRQRWDRCLPRDSQERDHRLPAADQTIVLETELLDIGPDCAGSRRGDADLEFTDIRHALKGPL